MAVNTYGCFTITADADENIVPLIFKQFSGNVPQQQYCKLKFVGFETTAGTKIKLNGVPNQVPSNGKFITPFEGGSADMVITSLSFDSGCSGLNIWAII